MTIGLLCSAGAYAILLYMLMKYSRSVIKTSNYKEEILLGSSIGLCWAGLAALLKKIAPSLEPFWGDFSSMSAYFPAIDVVINTVLSFVLQTIFMLLMIYLANMFTQNKKGYILQVALFIVLAFAQLGAQPLFTINHFLLSGIIASAFFITLYYSVLTHLASCIPWIVATLLICQSVQQAVLALYPTACIAHCIAIIVVFIVTWLWERMTRP
jgi:hypothetical protein